MGPGPLEWALPHQFGPLPLGRAGPPGATTIGGGLLE